MRTVKALWGGRIPLLVGGLVMVLGPWRALAEVQIPAQRPLPPFPYQSPPASPEGSGPAAAEPGPPRPTRPVPQAAPRPLPRAPAAPQSRAEGAVTTPAGTPPDAERPTPPASPARPPGVPAASGAPAQKDALPRLLISVRTDKSLYKNGERVRITGRVVNLAGELLPSVVDLRVARRDRSLDQPEYRILLEPRGPDFSDDGFSLYLPTDDSVLRGQQVEFVAAAEVTPRGGGESSVAATAFRAEEFGYLGLVKIYAAPVLIVFAFLVSTLLVFMMDPTKRAAKYAVWVVYASGWLFLLVGLVGPLLISASPSAETLIRTTPVGIAKVTTEKIRDLQWTINIGGTIGSDNVLKGGYAVPLFVLVLGIVGGVINMLLKLPDFLRDYEAVQAGDASEAARVSTLRDNVFKYFVYILTGPFLGMMVYSLVTLADYTNALALSIMGFSVGFVSDRIVQTLLVVAGNVLNRASSVFRDRTGDPVEPAVGPSRPR